MNPKRPTLSHIIIELAKVKDRIFKAAREKQLVTYRSIPVRLSADFSKETLRARRDCKDMRSRDLQPRLLYPAKLSFGIKGQIKSFPDKKKLKEFIITKSLLHEVLEGLKKKKIKTMNNKMAVNTNLSTIDSKILSKQEQQETELWIWRMF